MSRVPSSPNRTSTRAQDVINACRAASRSGDFSISERAHARARAREHTLADLRNVLAGVRSCKLDRDHWTVRGSTLDGTEVELNVVLAAEIITVV